jgi:hypothetical protein
MFDLTLFLCYLTTHEHKLYNYLAILGAIMKHNTLNPDKTYNTMISQYVFLIICVLPLFFIPYGFPYPFYIPKMLLWFASFVAILIIMFHKKWILHTPIFLKPNQTKDQKKILLLLVLYLLSWCISTLFSVDKGVSFWGSLTQNGLLQVGVGVATFLLVANHYIFKLRHLTFVATTYSIIALLAVLQFYRIDPLQTLYGEAIKKLNGQAFTTIGNQNQVATCLCVMYIITAFFFIISNKGQKVNRLLLAGVLVIFAGNVATNSKAGLVADVATMLVALPIIVNNRAFLKKYIQILAASIIIFIIMNLTSNSVVINRLLQMIFEGFNILHGNADADSGSGRVQIWINSIDLIKHYWLAGSGPDTFKQIYDTYGYNIINQSNDNIVVLSPHNESLRLIITTGIASLIFYWMLVISVIKLGFQKIKEDNMMLPLILGLLCYEIKLMFNCSSINDIVIFWVLLAIILSRSLNNNDNVFVIYNK